eukprot:XP_011412975.1 PREDICTED: uncharacterized protein LOC105317856 [Crassostrea gigas]
MALSKSQIPYTYLVCGTKDCKKNCQFYCNPCHQPLCEQCRDEHRKRNHNIVHYRQLPVEKCRIHHSKDVDLYCEECQIPLCSKCTATQEHRGHVFTDLEMIYAEKVLLFQKEVAKIRDQFKPFSKKLQEENPVYANEFKTITDDIKASMKAEAESLKSIVDAVTSDKIEQVNKIEQSALEKINGQNKKIDDYINYLNDLIESFYGHLSPTNIKNVVSVPTPKTHPLPEMVKPVPPVFTAGQYSREDVSILLGSVSDLDIKPENREKVAFRELKLTEKQRKQDKGTSDEKQTLSLASSVTKLREFRVPGVDNICHITVDMSGKFWVSDSRGMLIHIDLQGSPLLFAEMKSSGSYEGFHTTTRDGEMIYTEVNDKVVKRIAVDNTITEFTNTGYWTPLGIHSSHINGDILEGMVKKGVGAKVTRYTKTGKAIQNIEKSLGGKDLYKYPHFITENINGDICTSDFDQKAVVVVNESGQNRFSYLGQENLSPYAICTDLLGHILVCDGYSLTVLVLDKDCRLLSVSGDKLYCNVAVCVDNESNLLVGQRNNLVSVFKYLE